MAIQQLAPELFCYDRITASHVSASWRAASISDPLLWTDIVLSADNWSASDIDMFMTLLARSKTAAINIDLLCPTEPEQLPGFCWTLKEHLYHTKRLALRLWLGCWEEIESIFVDMPAPILESLVFTGTTDARLPEPLFKGHAPQLRRLRVEGFELPPVCPALSNVQIFVAQIDPTNPGVATREIRHLWDVLPNLIDITVSGELAGVGFPKQPPERFLNRVSLNSGTTATTYDLEAFDLRYVKLLELDDPNPQSCLEVVNVWDQPQVVDLSSSTFRGMVCYMLEWHTNDNFADLDSKNSVVKRTSRALANDDAQISHVAKYDVGYLSIGLLFLVHFREIKHVSLDAHIIRQLVQLRHLPALESLYVRESFTKNIETATSRNQRKFPRATTINVPNIKKIRFHGYRNGIASMQRLETVAQTLLEWMTETVLGRCELVFDEPNAQVLFERASNGDPALLGDSETPYDALPRLASAVRSVTSPLGCLTRV
ncbi:hypothetical protein BKA62DRAFT_714892 [Auriculariales sp. MPI-PUGE-AT-0066]|nr:hypothetical protein BKA62DRAFT_714892 [Auriculariales sp. MPI-PUGE-AT-0066]